MASKYFVFLGREDGGCFVKECTEEEVLKGLVPGKYGEKPFGDGAVVGSLPRDICNFSDILIIKGEIIIPKPKRTVVEYEL